MLHSSPADVSTADPPDAARVSEPDSIESASNPVADTGLATLLRTVEHLFSDLAAAREDGAMAALLGESVTPLCDRQRSLYDQATQAVGERFEARRRELANRETELRAEAEATREMLTPMIERRKALSSQLRALIVEEAEAAEQARGDLRSAVAARDQNIRAQRQAEALAEFENIVESAKREAELTTLRGEGFDDQRKRSAEQKHRFLEEEFAAVSKLLDESRQLNHALQLRGFTRNIARFLNWSSMLSILGIGIVLAHVFVGSFPQLGVEASWVSRLRGLLNLDQADSLAGAFGRYAALLAAGWLAAAVALGVTIWILHLTASRSKHSEVSRERGQSDVGAWASMFGLPGGGVGENLPTVDRSFLLQVVAILPVLFVGAVLAFFWVMTSDPGNVAPEADPTSFHLVYLGSLYAVMTATAGTLFWLYVIRPRLAGERVELLTAIFYSISFVAPLAGLFVLAWAGPTSARGSIAFVGAALLLTSGAAGHGIYLKGLFAREAYLEKARQRAFAALFGHGRTVEGKQRKASLSEGSRFSRWLQRFWGQPESKRAPKQGDLTDVNIRSALRYARSGVESVQTVNASQAARETAAAKKATMEGELGVLSREIAQLEARATSMAGECDACSRELLEVLEAHAAALIRLHERHDRLQTALAHAFALGQFFKGART